MQAITIMAFSLSLSFSDQRTLKELLGNEARLPPYHLTSEVVDAAKKDETLLEQLKEQLDKFRFHKEKDYDFSQLTPEEQAILTG